VPVMGARMDTCLKTYELFDLEAGVRLVRHSICLRMVDALPVL
jgi:hypothetical protein